MSDNSKASKIMSIDMCSDTFQNLYNVDFIQGDYILNGYDNINFLKVDNAYWNSATNKSVIDRVSGYIYGEGILSNSQPIKDIISNKTLRCFIEEYKRYGMASLEVIYNAAKKVAKLEFISITEIGIQRQDDFNAAPQVFWHSKDWMQQNKFRPQAIPAFGTVGFSAGKELLVIGLKHGYPYFVEPDYKPALFYAEWEQKFAEYILSHIENGFSAGHIINVFGVENSPENQAIAAKKIREQLTGSRNAGKFFLSFNEDPTNATTIDAIEVSEAHKQYEFLTVEAEKKILMSHGYFPILLGVQGATGFSNNADELNTALKVFYRNVVRPMREEIIDALESVLKINDPNINLEFKDFDELLVSTESIDEPIDETLPDNIIVNPTI